MAYWRERLAGLPGLQLPIDRPRPAVETFRGGHRPVALSASLTGRLNALARGEGVTLFMTLLAAFQTLLLRYTGQTDLPVGSPIATATQRDEGSRLLRQHRGAAHDARRPDFSGLLGRDGEVTPAPYAHEDCRWKWSGAQPARQAAIHCSVHVRAQTTLAAVRMVDAS